MKIWTHIRTLTLLAGLTYAPTGTSRGTDLGNNGDDIRLVYFHAVYIAQDILSAFPHDQRLIDGLESIDARRWYANQANIESLVRNIAAVDHVWLSRSDKPCVWVEADQPSRVYLSFDVCNQENPTILDAVAALINASHETRDADSVKGTGEGIIRAWTAITPAIAKQLVSSDPINVKSATAAPDDYPGSYETADGTIGLRLSSPGEAHLSGVDLEIGRDYELNFPLLIRWEEDNARFHTKGILEYVDRNRRPCTLDVGLYLIPGQPDGQMYVSLVVPVIESGCRTNGDASVKYFVFKRR